MNEINCTYCDKPATHRRGSETPDGCRPVCKTHARMYDSMPYPEFVRIMGAVEITPQMKEWLEN